MNLTYGQIEKKLDISFIGSDLQMFQLLPGIYEVFYINHTLPSIKTVTTDDFRLGKIVRIETIAPTLWFSEKIFFPQNSPSYKNGVYFFKFHQ